MTRTEKIRLLAELTGVMVLPGDLLYDPSTAKYYPQHAFFSSWELAGQVVEAMRAKGWISVINAAWVWFRKNGIDGSAIANGGSTGPDAIAEAACAAVGSDE